MRRGADDDALFVEALEMAVQLPSDIRRRHLLDAYSGETSFVREVMDGAANHEEMGDFLLEPLIPRTVLILALHLANSSPAASSSFGRSARAGWESSTKQSTASSISVVR